MKQLTIGMILSLAFTCGWAQLPKLNAGSIKEKAQKTVTSEAKDAGGDASQRRASLENDCKNVETNLASAEWEANGGLTGIQSTLKTLATDIAKCQASNNPGEKALGKQYLEKYIGYLGTYQSKAPMGSQQIDPPMAEEAQKKAHEIFNKISYAYRQLNLADAKPKGSWGDQEYVDLYKKNMDEITAKAAEYKSADPDDYAKVGRYTEAIKANEKLYSERKEFPARRTAATKFMDERSNQYRLINQASPEFPDHVEFLEANEGFNWAEMRTHTDFLHEWGMRPNSNNAGSSFTILDWVDEYPPKVKADLNKQMEAAKALASSAKYDYTKWQAAERNLNLAKSAVLMYPKDAALASAVTAAQTLRDDRYKKYETVTFTSDYHRKNVYSVGISTTGAVGFKPMTGFKAGDKVIFTVFLDRPADLLTKEGGLAFRLKEIWDNEEAEGYKIEAADLGKSYIDIVLINDRPSNKDMDEAEESILRELCMAKGKTVNPTFQILMGGEKETPVQLLKFSFDGTNTAGITTYFNRWNSLNAKRLADVRVPKGSGGSNPAMEAEFGKLFQDKYGPKDVKEVLKVRLDDADWTVKRNEFTGIILSRQRQTIVVYKRVDGTCRVEGSWYGQDSQGGGKFGPSYWNGVGNNFEIHCGNVDK